MFSATHLYGEILLEQVVASGPVVAELSMMMFGGACIECFLQCKQRLRNVVLPECPSQRQLLNGRVSCILSETHLYKPASANDVMSARPELQDNHTQGNYMRPRNKLHHRRPQTVEGNFTCEVRFRHTSHRTELGWGNNRQRRNLKVCSSQTLYDSTDTVREPPPETREPPHASHRTRATVPKSARALKVCCNQELPSHRT